MTEYECIECGCLFKAKLAHDDSEDDVLYCVNCGTQLEDDLDEIELLYLDGVIMDLEPPIRDAIVLDLPVNPLCDPDCMGLCPDCGQKWALLAQDHAHEVIDARWAGLDGLDFKNSDS